MTPRIRRWAEMCLAKHKCENEFECGYADCLYDLLHDKFVFVDEDSLYAIAYNGTRRVVEGLELGELSCFR